MKKILVAFLLIFMIGCSANREAKYEADAKADYVSTNEAESPATEEEGESHEFRHQIQSGQITAGEWNDLEHWDFWNSLNQKQDFSGMADHWSFNLENRVPIHLRSGSENICDAPVELLDANGKVIWKARTNNKGNAELWPSMKRGNQTSLKGLKAKINNHVFENLEVSSQGKINLVVSDAGQSNSYKKIDIAFMVDATGSMGDELEYLKAELTDVIDKVKESNPNATVNTGSVFYRDHGDSYVTKSSDFTNNFDKTISFIKDQSADGGGDFPEAVDKALKESIENLQWSSNATSRILFLVLDAPPHYDQQVISEIHDLIKEASAKGIKIIPITASGIDKETEFLMRYMAIATNGTYVFITDDSGIGNSHLEASVGDYQVEHLNKLMERLINESLE